ncbi:MAG TPA: serine/threonine-protein kinase, partial [Xanthomonadales bacterium]|nr:serine/threonine-protein kinase [Xanthomonadales bacterium]
MNPDERESPALTAQRILRELRLGDEAGRRAAVRRIESDPTLRQQVERLMAATVDSQPSTNTRTEPAHLPRIGVYTLIAELGSGGMGAVFLAEREVDGARQRVALKLLHGIPTEDGRRRFARERALLAGLNHPHIAALLDGGQTADGQPFLVMEYIEGEPIDEWVRRTRPDLPTRLRTLVRVCRAVEHAHQRLVLHRDIKPGNVLVRADGDPVLLDFGIGRELSDGHALAETATLAFTPAYAAPEQFSGRGLTTATDVFGLGALLYEVASGASLTELRRGAEMLPLPSVAASDTHLRAQLSGDLDRIAGKAMHAEPERRYASAAALADDLERFLQGRPVLATPDSLGYRVAKFVGRHRSAVVVAGLALLLSAGFVWRLDIERTRALEAEASARRESASARLARDFLVSVFQSASPRETLGRPVSPRDLLDRARKRVESELGADPAAAVSTWMALSDTYNALGEPGAAAHAAEQALRYTGGNDVAQRLQRANVIEALGAAYNQLGRYPEAVPLYEELLRLREELSADDPVALANTYGELGYAAQQYGEHERSAQWLQRALELLDSQRQRNLGDAEDRCYVLSGLAVAAAAGGDEAGARRWLEAAQTARAAIDPSHPAGLFVLRASARVAELQGRFDDSVSELQAASELARRVIGADASVVAGIENDLGVALNGLGRYREALQHLERARSMYLRRANGADANVAHLDANISAIY